MKPLVARARLLLLGGAAVLFIGGMIFAVARWMHADTDRAFVEAAAAAASQTVRNATPMHAWVPAPGAVPTRGAEDAIERVRRRLPAQPVTGLDTKPPAMPR